MFVQRSSLYRIVWLSIMAWMQLPSEGYPVNKGNLIDLTHPYDEQTLQFRPSAEPFRLEIIHNGTHERGYWYQTDKFSTPSHSGTHMDAPCHFSPGKWSIADIPTDRLIAPAVVVDIAEKASANRNALLDVNDLENWENVHGRIPDGCVLFVRTGWDRCWPNRKRVFGTEGNDMTQYSFPGIDPEAARWLVTNRRLYGVGIDTPSLDNGPSRMFESHQIILGTNIYGLENVANLGLLPQTGITAFVMPMKIAGASGAPCRILAAFDGNSSHVDNE